LSAPKVKVRFESFTKCFGDLLVLDNMDASLYENEFICIVGPTGCGKTTLANVVCGLLPPTKGKVTVDGTEVDSRKHNIAFVFQEVAILPWKTVEDNIKLGLELKNFPKGVIKTRVHEMIDLLGLRGFEKSFPNQISGGMKQRVDIARAFCAETDLLFMDEPFCQNDEKTRFYMLNLLIQLWEKKKRTIIFVTHNIEEAVYLAERIIVFTQKPTKIREEIMVNLPRPRDVTAPEFVKIRERVTELIKWW